jgi:hypothetical protein
VCIAAEKTILAASSLTAALPEGVRRIWQKESAEYNVLSEKSAVWNTGC